MLSWRYKTRKKVPKDEIKKFVKLFILVVKNWEKVENFRFFGHFRFTCVTLSCQNLWNQSFCRFIYHIKNKGAKTCGSNRNMENSDFCQQTERLFRSVPEKHPTLGFWMSDGRSLANRGSDRGSNPNRRFMALSKDGSRWYISRSLPDYNSKFTGFPTNWIPQSTMASSRLCPTDLEWGVLVGNSWLPVLVELESD